MLKRKFLAAIRAWNKDNPSNTISENFADYGWYFIWDGIKAYLYDGVE